MEKIKQSIVALDDDAIRGKYPAPYISRVLGKAAVEHNAAQCVALISGALDDAAIRFYQQIPQVDGILLQVAGTVYNDGFWFKNGMTYEKWRKGHRGKEIVGISPEPAETRTLAEHKFFFLSREMGNHHELPSEIRSNIFSPEEVYDRNPDTDDAVSSNLIQRV